MTLAWTWCAPRITGFSTSLWLKRLEAFRADVHCIESLSGARDRAFGREMPTGVRIDGAEWWREGDLAYFCGVSYPSGWRHNLHLAGRVKAGARAEIRTYQGELLTVEGLERITFNDEAARAAFPERGDRFLTCRNFQFAAWAESQGLVQRRGPRAARAAAG